MATEEPDYETRLTAARVDPELARTAVIAAIDRSAPLPPSTTAEDALAATMCAFSQRLSRGKAVRVELGLPKTLVPFIVECVAHRGENAELDSGEDFLQRLASHLGTSDEQANEVASVVLGAVQRILPVEEVDEVAGQLPEGLREIWETAAP